MCAAAPEGVGIYNGRKVLVATDDGHEQIAVGKRLILYLLHCLWNIYRRDVESLESTASDLLDGEHEAVEGDAVADDDLCVVAIVANNGCRRVGHQLIADAIELLRILVSEIVFNPLKDGRKFVG